MPDYARLTAPLTPRQRGKSMTPIRSCPTGDTTIALFRWPSRYAWVSSALPFDARVCGISRLVEGRCDARISVPRVARGVR